jgi:hypothetical protein
MRNTKHAMRPTKFAVWLKFALLQILPCARTSRVAVGPRDARRARRSPCREGQHQARPMTAVTRTIPGRGPQHQTGSLTGQMLSYSQRTSPIEGVSAQTAEPCTRQLCHGSSSCSLLSLSATPSPLSASDDHFRRPTSPQQLLTKLHPG